MFLFHLLQHARKITVILIKIVPIINFEMAMLRRRRKRLRGRIAVLMLRPRLPLTFHQKII